MKKTTIIILLIVTFSCQGQEKNEEFYTPIELSYFHNSSLFTLNEKVIMNYTLVNPLVARQVYDYNLKEFQEINSKVNFTKAECSDLIYKYVNFKTDSTYFGVFYNPNSNQKLSSKKITDNGFYTKSNTDSVFYKCICINSKYLNLPEDYEEIQSEYNSPGGYELKNKGFKNKVILKMIGSLNKENFDSLNIFILSKKINTIKSTKTLIYSSPNSPTKMYLLKGDEVEIIKEKDEWLKIRYYGKKTIEGWIMKSDVE
jgi:hypothetical protein